MDDTAIVALFEKRDESAITQIDEKYGKLCYSVICRVLSDERDAEECVNDTWSRVWNAIPPDRPTSLRAYVARVARNLALDRYGYNNAEKRSSRLTDAFEEIEPYLPASGDRFVEESEFSEFLNGFLSAQSKDNRIMFVRRYWYGESIEEIAKALGFSEAKVKTSVFRTRKRLRDAMSKEGITI